MPGLLAELESLRTEVVTRLVDLGAARDAVRVEHRADLRFEGQEHTVTVELDPSWGPDDVEAIRRAFVARHRQLFGHGDDDALVELVTLRCRGLVPGVEPRWPRWTTTTESAPRTERSVFFREAGGNVTTRIYDRDALAIDQAVVGPAIIEEWTSTTVVPPGWSARTEHEGSVVLTRGARR